jgi:hypothetical protein
MARKSTNGQKANTTSATLTQEEELHLTTLSKHKHIFDFYMKTQEIVNFHPHIRLEVVNAYKFWNPHYHYDDKCPVCIAEMLHTIYSFYNLKQ